MTPPTMAIARVRQRAAIWYPPCSIADLPMTAVTLAAMAFVVMVVFIIVGSIAVKMEYKLQKLFQFTTQKSE